MRKVTLSAMGLFLAATFTSCEKNYTCTCTFPNQNPSVTESTFKAKEDDARARCNQENAEAQVQGGTCALN